MESNLFIGKINQIIFEHWEGVPLYNKLKEYVFNMELTVRE